MESELLKFLEEEEKEVSYRFNALMEELKQSSIHGDFFANEIIKLMNELIDIKVERTRIERERLADIKQPNEALRRCLNILNKGG